MPSDSDAMRHFAGIEAGDDPIPEDTAILDIRHLQGASRPGARCDHRRAEEQQDTRDGGPSQPRHAVLSRPALLGLRGRL